MHNRTGNNQWKPAQQREDHMETQLCIERATESLFTVETTPMVQPHTKLSMEMCATENWVFLPARLCNWYAHVIDTTLS